mmetsp:Transcript_36133/g.93982  ORF Transcript_36133/g.93982 Transcript_36133/m.93982 type:complete len:160 (-) Transcript_36133:653-1132(-)
MNSIAFPELSVSALFALRRTLKLQGHDLNPGLRRKIKQLSDLLQSSARKLEVDRSLTTFAPKDTDAIRGFEDTIRVNPIQAAWDTERKDIERESRLLKEAHLAHGGPESEEDESDDEGHAKTTATSATVQQDLPKEEEEEEEAFEGTVDLVKEMDLENF